MHGQQVAGLVEGGLIGGNARLHQSREPRVESDLRVGHHDIPADDPVLPVLLLPELSNKLELAVCGLKLYLERSV